MWNVWRVVPHIVLTSQAQTRLRLNDFFDINKKHYKKFEQRPLWFILVLLTILISLFPLFHYFTTEFLTADGPLIIAEKFAHLVLVRERMKNAPKEFFYKHDQIFDHQHLKSLGITLYFEYKP